MRKNKKTIIAILATVCVLALAIGGTLAWLQDAKTDDQTFTGGDHVYVTSVTHNVIDDVKIIPGKTVEFNPTITVDNSVDAYVFIQFDNGAEYVNIAPENLSGWLPLENVDGVFYREISGVPAGSTNTLSVFNDGTITFDSNLTNETVPSGEVTVSLRALAIQADYIGSVQDAWAQVSSN